MTNRKRNGGGPVRYAVVGQGYIAQAAVLPAFAHAKRNSRLVALFSGDETKRREYDEDIDIVRLASELVVDDVVTPEMLRGELVRRFRHYRRKDRHFSHRRHGVTPV